MDLDDGKNPVRLAERKDLFRILTFLDSKLPAYSDLHRMVLAAIHSWNPFYRVYFISDPNNHENYFGIVAAKEDKGQNATIENKKMWFISSAWSVTELALLQLYDAMRVVIDWSRDEFTIYYLQEHQQNVKSFLQKAGRKLEEFPFYEYMLDIPSGLKIEIKMPENLHISSLERHKYGQYVFNRWAYRDHTTEEDVGDELDQLPSAGLFSKDSNEMVAWVTLHPHFGMSRLHTLEAHRRKGYGTLVVQYLTKRMAQAGYLPTYGLAINNVASKAFVEAMGFRFIGTFSSIASFS